MIKNIIFLSNDPPLKSKGSGISVLLYNISQAIRTKYNVQTLTFCKDSAASVEDIKGDNKYQNIDIIDRKIANIYSILKYGKLKTIMQFCIYLCQLPRLVKKIDHSDNLIITFVGASIIPVIHAWFLMSFAHKPKHALYVVDDLELINKIQNNKIELFLIKIFLGRAIKKADVFINISNGLRNLYLKQFGKDSYVLLPHFGKKQILENNTEKNKFIFLFTGGLNLLYNESLILFSNALENLNERERNGVEYNLVIQTYSSKKEFDDLNFNSKYVFYNTTNDRSQLFKVYEKADCFLVPYSFSTRDRGMVETSFPQKTAEIIQYGKKILIFGPKYSSVSEFFSQNNLPFVCNENSLSDLLEVIRKISNSNYDVFDYTNTYEKYLSVQAVLKLFDKVVQEIS